MIQVAIIEDDQIIREGIRDYVNSQPDMICMVDKDSVERFLAVLDRDHLPDVILMDIGLPGMTGISGIKILKEQFPDINIIMLTVYNASSRIFRSVCAGASGYLLKNIPFSEILEAIKTVYGGGSSMSPQIARKVVDYFQENHYRKPAMSPLTSKEKEIVMGLVDGLSYKMIADSASISLETVRTHIKNIYKKLHVHCKAEVIRKSLNGEI